jgi:hypothetical protein
MVGGEITAVSRVKCCRDSSDPPLRQGLTPYRLAQHQGRVEARGGLQAQPKAGNGATVVIHDDGEPGPHRWATLLAYPEVQQGMIGLPEVIGLGGFVSGEEIVGGTGGLAPGVGQRDQSRVQMLHDPRPPAIVGHGPAVAKRHVTHVAVDKGHSRGWCA